MNRSTLRTRIANLLPDEPLVLLKGQLGTDSLNSGIIKYVYKPHSSLTFSMVTGFPYPISICLTMPDLYNSTSEAFVIDTSLAPEADRRILHGIVCEDIEYGFDNNIYYSDFYIVNFHIYTDSYGEVDGTEYTTECGEWEISMCVITRDEGKYKRAEHCEGYVFTHAAEIRRKDRQSFSPADAMEFISFLELALGFCKGGRIACVLPAGYTQGNTPVWERWEINSNSSPIDYNGTWFIKNNSHVCLNAISQIYQKWQDDTYRKWYSLAMKLYVEANRNTAGTEIALSNAQTLLEMLCWIALVQEARLMTAQALENENASGRITKLLQWVRIPPSIPDDLEHLVKAASVLKKPDGPSAITALRNKMIHPTQPNLAKLDAIDVMAFYEAWQLCMWYSELVMLKLFDYTGMYNNRLQRASYMRAEKVPWDTTP